MRTLWALACLGLPFVLACGYSSVGSSEAGTRRLSRSTLEDKVRGGWAGQMIGVSFGAPNEFKYNSQMIEGALPA